MSENQINVLEHLEAYYENATIDDIKRDIVETQKAIDELDEQNKTFKALENLEKNNDWIEFKDAYFKREKERISNALTSVSPFREETEKQLHDKLTSIRHLKMFINFIEIDARNNGELIKELEQRVKDLNIIIKKREEINGK